LIFFIEFIIQYSFSEGLRDPLMLQIHFCSSKKLKSQYKRSCFFMASTILFAMWGYHATIAVAYCQGCCLLPVPKPSALSLGADTIYIPWWLKPLPSAEGSMASDCSGHTTNDTPTSSLWALGALVICQ
jgi:hypothetical protein